MLYIRKYHIFMELIDRIVRNIDERRVSQNLTVDKLSKIADIPLSTITKIRSKLVKDVRITTLEALAKALKCSVDDLIKWFP